MTQRSWRSMLRRTIRTRGSERGVSSIFSSTGVARFRQSRQEGRVKKKRMRGRSGSIIGLVGRDNGHPSVVGSTISTVQITQVLF
ncbi:hypothetical protein QLX08_010121 [Tetragonisca angustula]|uniref:Uncharacterized protein n=1 Tax=Tetragonisca angustula TaxID=166442 RepID=A0AAW0ZDA8_9HYME